MHTNGTLPPPVHVRPSRRETAEAFADWLNGEMSARHWNQGDVSRRLAEVDPNESLSFHARVRSWCRGVSLPSAPYAYLLAEVFEVAPDYVLGLAGHRVPKGAPNLVEGKRAYVLAMVEGAALDEDDWDMIAGIIRIREKQRDQAARRDPGTSAEG